MKKLLYKIFATTGLLGALVFIATILVSAIFSIDGQNESMKMFISLSGTSMIVSMLGAFFVYMWKDIIKFYKS